VLVTGQSFCVWSCSRASSTHQAVSSGVRWCLTISHRSGGDICRYCVPQNVADGRDLWARDIRVSTLQLLRQTPTCLRDDFNPALDDPLLFPVLSERLERRGTCFFADVFNRLNDVCQVGDDG
jgi:hypothetical protein